MLHAEADTTSAGPTLLLIHPMGADLSFWDELRPLWSGMFNCIAMDLLGAGLSPAADRPITIDDQVLALEALVAELKIDRFIPVGCAIGGTTAAAFAARNPGHCQALVLSNPSLATTPTARKALSARAELVRARGMAAVMPAAVDSAFHGQDDPLRRSAYDRRFAQQDPASYANIVDGMLHADVRAVAPSIACPTLIVTGNDDVLLPPAEHSIPLQAMIPGAELRMVEGGAHFIPYQRPAEFSALVIDFVRRHVP